MPGFETFDAGSMAAQVLNHYLILALLNLVVQLIVNALLNIGIDSVIVSLLKARAAYNLQRADALKDTLQQYQLDVAAKKNAGLNPALGEGQGAVTMSQPDINAQDNGAIQSSSGQVTFNPLLQAHLKIYGLIRRKS